MALEGSFEPKQVQMGNRLANGKRCFMRIERPFEKDRQDIRCMLRCDLTACENIRQVLLVVRSQLPYAFMQPTVFRICR